MLDPRCCQEKDSQKINKDIYKYICVYIFYSKMSSYQRHLLETHGLEFRASVLGCGEESPMIPTRTAGVMEHNHYQQIGYQQTATVIQ